MKPNQKIRSLILIVIMTVLSGCALTNEPVSLNYSPKLSGVKKVSSSRAFTVGKFKDERGVDPKLVTHKINLNGQEAAGMILAEKPIADILQKSVENALKKTGYRVKKNGLYSLNGNLLGLNMHWIEGFVHSDLQCNIQFEFILSDRMTGKELWEETYNGVGFYRGKTDDGAPIPMAFSRAADNLIYKILNDSDFIKMMR